MVYHNGGGAEGSGDSVILTRASRKGSPFLHTIMRHEKEIKPEEEPLPAETPIEDEDLEEEQDFEVGDLDEESFEKDDEEIEERD